MTRKSLLGLFLCVMFLSAGLVRADSPDGSKTSDNQQVASVEELKTEAFKALHSGDFDRTNTLIAKAASMSSDPGLAQMKTWVSDFETQRQTFESERRKQYDKAVADVQKLSENHLELYAIDSAARVLAGR